MSSERTNLIGFSQQKLKAYFQQLEQPAYRATQVLQWIHQHGVSDFTEMTNLSKSLREQLAQIADVDAPAIMRESVSADGTCKWLMSVDEKNSVETVFIPEDKRGTLCISSQVGCALNCSFCSTGKQGFNRNLDSAHIIGQVWRARARLQALRGPGKHITNVVMMGMGEPLLNYYPVVMAMEIMLDDLAYGLAKRRVTLSTSGVVPEMLRLKQDSPVALAVSLHAPNNALRNELVPLNKKYPLEQLMPVCRDYFAGQHKRVVTFEYVMLDGVNDTKAHAHELVDLLRGVPGKVNLIPFNPFPGAPYRRSSEDAIERFRDILVRSGINTITRKTRGDDIDAACGQLVGQFQDRTRRHARWQASIDPKDIPIRA